MIRLAMDVLMLLCIVAAIPSVVWVIGIMTGVIEDDRKEQ